MKTLTRLSALAIASILAACGGSDSTSAPQISTQPAATSAFAGGSATLTVQASGDGLTYQWLRNGVPIAGATGASYTVSSISTVDQGASYTVVVGNSGGSATSGAAVLSVVPVDVASRRQFVRLAVNMQALSELTFSGLAVFGSDGWLAGFSPTRCASGTAAGTLDGVAVQSGAGFGAGKHTLQATFNDCEWDPASFLSGGWSATIDATAIPVNATGWTIDAQFAAARTRYLGPDTDANYDDQATGSLRVTWRAAPAGAGVVEETILIEPVAGLALTNNRMGASGKTATLLAGSYLVRDRYDPTSPFLDGETEYRHEALRYVVDGVPFLAQGSRFAKWDREGNLIDASGEMVVTSNGLRVGRIFGANTPAPDFYYEYDGQIVALSAASDRIAPVAARAARPPLVAARRAASLAQPH